MQRRHFVKKIGALGLGTPLMVNGLLAQANSFLNSAELSVGLDCADVSDRILVIVRLAGANDGLNTVIPVNQYDRYAAIRPQIKIPNTGTGAFINLGSDLPNDRLSGLHPSLTGFKSLYDSGKLAIVNGVGSPAPNYSHFAAENIMFAGQDGRTSTDLDDGMMGRYLSKVFPGRIGKPTLSLADPLALNFGTSNRVLMFNSADGTTAEYNMTGIEGTLFSKLKTPVLPDPSAHRDLLDYITSIQQSADVYLNRINTAFNQGNNSTVTYPNNGLAKQLKTVARLLKGGSRTKIFQVTLSGFDTHIDQVVNGAAHTGTHANLLKDLSDSILAFQNDLEALGLADRVMTVSFSEFGRQVRQNANRGTDHGDISPFFVFGKHVQPGVLGSHPTLPSNTSFFYPEAERKHDYRQIYATLLQDWLGASNTAMQAVFPTTFTKLPLVASAQNAAPACLSNTISICDSTTSVETTTASKALDNATWSYYTAAGLSTNPILLGIEHKPSGTGGNSANFTATATFYKLTRVEQGSLVFSKLNASLGNGFFVGGHYFQLNITSGTPNGYINIRFFFDRLYLDELSTAATDFNTSINDTANQSPLIYAKSNNALSFPNDIRSDALGFSQAATPLILASSSAYAGRSYFQFNQITQFNNMTFCSFICVQQQFPELLDANSRVLRFNTTTSKFESWTGTQWVNLHN